MEKDFWKDKIQLAAFVGTVAVCAGSYYSLRWARPYLNENQSLVTTAPISTPAVLNPRLEVSALCLSPKNISGESFPWRIRLSIKGVDIDTGPEGVWTVIKNLNTGQSAITSYTGNNRTAIYNGENHEGFINPIRWPDGEYKRPWVYSGAPYGIEVIEGAYTERFPNLGKVVARKNIITPSCP